MLKKILKKNSNKINIKSFREIGGRLLVLLENLIELSLIFVMFRPKVWEKLNLNSFLSLKI
jgi:hypothetical protein